ncbi:MAG: type II toxin-antitoxin system HicA family toxin [Caldilineaceae bacterium SB0670_bin_27]|uniref:Type II toxin-antitoxin system HicA family toxin n=1 Tax=Caldilineaceae bacterium SB0664_bin_27 TaxID=2605260 RepID=A0A6B0YRK2_9CHLR|nr:type II toxin-antitoxin system HicA family toxin [Caldilineaceae bacterium SB0664_bin_27]MYJ79912.1 type II toxin-antitoxin system HicA family toxin [Caldilineaceae bacterium SB0670_bin_27]
MGRFPSDAPKQRVIRTLEALGFRIVRTGNHIAMIRENRDGSRDTLTLPNHRRLKGSTLRRICTQTGIPREEFLEAFIQA